MGKWIWTKCHDNFGFGLGNINWHIILIYCICLISMFVKILTESFFECTVQNISIALGFWVILANHLNKENALMTD